MWGETLAAVTEPGHTDDVAKRNEDESGGNGTRFCFLIFRNEIPDFMIFRNQILMTGKKQKQKNTQETKQECNKYHLNVILPTKCHQTINEHLPWWKIRCRWHFSPGTCPRLEVGWRYRHILGGTRHKGSGCSWLWAQELGAHPAVTLLISATPGWHSRTSLKRRQQQTNKAPC